MIAAVGRWSLSVGGEGGITNCTDAVASHLDTIKDIKSTIPFRPLTDTY